MAGIERQSLGDAVKRYNGEGLAGLYDRPKPDRTRKLAAGQETELGAIILDGPEVEGISAYTLEDLGLTKQKLGRKISPWRSILPPRGGGKSPERVL